MAAEGSPAGDPGGNPGPDAPRRRRRVPGLRGRPRRFFPRVEEVSAGGLVLDRRSMHASGVLIGRLDRRGTLLWSLPKGHVEPGETQEVAAIREVAEETGIQARIVAPLGSIDFWFTADGRRIHKTVHHYLLIAEGGELSDEDIEVTEVAWVPLAQVPNRLAHATERALLRRVPDALARIA